MNKKKCPICGTEMKIDTSAVCASIPPKFRCECPSCNCVDFIKTSEYDKYKEEPLTSSNLDEAARMYSERSRFHWPNQVKPVYDAFKAGAEWMAGQGVSADSKISKLAGRAWVTPINEKQFMQDVHDNFVSGEEVIVQIRKKQ